MNLKQSLSKYMNIFYILIITLFSIIIINIFSFYQNEKHIENLNEIHYNKIKNLELNIVDLNKLINEFLVQKQKQIEKLEEKLNEIRNNHEKSPNFNTTSEKIKDLKTKLSTNTKKPNQSSTTPKNKRPTEEFVKP
ncbi:hypothetical protein PA0312 [Candidatus Phytoplasma australiense]|uniref:Uncharacterized protein n=1 Tax=Phytoplasma australiense TaxID=59748 RepID=B1V9M5_PHYAS|nr:hypothetical protein PA0312 [Candidatus Phytoplasma australiense]